MEYLRGFRKLREDPEWLSKLGVGSLLLLSAMVVPFLGQVTIAGWTALILRRAVAGQDDRLPTLDFQFDYLGKLFGTGFKGFVAAFVWGLPAGLLIGVGVVGLYLGMMFGAIAASSSGEGGAMLAVLCVFAVALPTLMIVGTLLALPAQMALIRAEIADDLNQGLQFGPVLEMTRKVFRELLIGALILGVVQTVLVFGSLLLCYLPLLPSMVAMQVARAHVGAQLYQLYLERGGQALPMGPLDVDPRTASRGVAQAF